MHHYPTERAHAPPSQAEILNALAPELARRFGTEASATDLELKHLQRGIWGCRVSIESSGEADGRRARWLTIIKVEEDEIKAERVFLNQQRLFEAGFDVRLPGRIGVPRPYARIRDAVLMERVPGDTVRKVYRRRPEPELARRLARVAVRLHSLPPFPVSEAAGGRRRLLGESAVVDLASHADLRQPAEIAYEGALELVRSFGEVPQKMLHGDYHWAQVMVDSEGDCYLLDVSPGKRGDPAADIAQFLAQLEKHRDETWFAEFHNAFLGEYLQLVGREILARILTYQALYLLRFAAKYSHQTPDPKHLTLAQMTDRAVELVAEARALTAKDRSA